MKNRFPFQKLKKCLTYLVQVEERLDYKPGQTIFYEGHYPCGIYVLRKGRIRLSRKKDNDQEDLLQIVEPGHVFGEDSYDSEPKPFDCSAQAETDVSISFFSGSALKACEDLKKY